MATVNFGIPDKIKEVFNAVFAGRNKSAIIAELMLRAVEEQRSPEARSLFLSPAPAERYRKQIVIYSIITI